MERTMYLEKIKDRIVNSEKGTVFIISDFLDIASEQTIKKGLSRLAENKIIRRIMRGVYDYPEFSDLLGEYVAASPDKGAHALARNYGWTIAPGGDAALNLLGLSTQVPAVWSYVSDGTYKKYKFNGYNIEFKHRTNRDVSKVSPKTALVIQALKAIGKDNVTEKIILRLSKVLNDEEKSTMLAEAKYATSWIYEIIKRVCSG
jgi:hypothetical protein